MSEKILLSIVIPVYNVEKYLKECLDSIFDPSAGEEEYEVVAIDDGSTDGSPEILKTYAHHKNFRIITQENAGLSVARNSGIKAVSGKYIYFVDSDDYLLPGTIPVLLNWARESDCDIIEFDNQTTDDKGNPIDVARSQMNRAPSEGRGKDLLAEWYNQRAFFEIVCIRLYRKEFIQNNFLFFVPGIVNEDTDWQFRCFFLAEKVVYHPVIIYNYRRRTGSLSVAPDRLTRFRNLMKVIDLLVSFRNTIDINEENAAFLAAMGEFFYVLLEPQINFFYKSLFPRSQKDYVFSELKKRKHLLGLATNEKGKRIYRLARWLPAGIALRLYKIF